MADYDPDVFGGQPQSKTGYDPDVFKGAKSVAPVDFRAQIANDPISKGARTFAAQGSDALGGLSQATLNLLAGGARGAGSIGSTIARPFESGDENDARRARIDENMQSVGAQPDSFMYQAGKLGTEVAGTLAVGGVGGKVASKVLPTVGVSPAATTAISQGLETGGFRAGGSTGAVRVATRVGTGATTGAASTGLVDPKDAAAGAVIGGAAPPVLQTLGKTAELVGSVARKAFGQATPEVAALAQRAKELGIDIPADRLVDSRPLNAVASSLNYVPLSGRAVTEDIMNSQLNRAVSRTVGQDSSNVTLALRKADEKLGGAFEKTLSENGVVFDQQLLEDLAAVHNKADAELGSDAMKPIQAKISQLIQKGQDGVIDGQAAYNIKRELDQIGKRSGPEAYHALELKGALMDALNRTLGPDKAAEFATVRKQYGNMLALEKIAPNGAEGEISAARLSNMRNINNPELQELADIASQFVKPREGAHGAAQRVMGASGVLGTVGGVGAIVGGPVGAAVSAGSAMAGARIANTMLNSNTARNAILGTVDTSAQPAMGALTQRATQAIPVMGGAAFGGANAIEAAPVIAPHSQSDQGEQSRPTSAAPQSIEQGTAAIGAAKSVDEAIAAAGAAVDAPVTKSPAWAKAEQTPIDVPRLPAIAQPAPMTAPASPAPAPTGLPRSGVPISQAGEKGEPDSQWYGRRGSGYLNPQDASMALPARQRSEPDLSWRVEAMQNGRYRLAGYQQAADRSGAQMNSTGTAMIAGNSDTIRKLLSDYGVTSTIPTKGGVLVAKGQAQQAMEILGQLGWNSGEQT